MMVSDIVLGMQVEFRARLKRQERARPGNWSCVEKTWTRFERGGHGVVCGVRTLRNGYAEHMGEGGASWKTESAVQAVMIATGLHVKPVFVMPGDVRNVSEQIGLEFDR